MATIVVDPGHGGTERIGGSSPNNATSSSGVPEKQITLDIAKRIRFSLENGSGREAAQELGKEPNVILTRDSDVNLGLSARAEVAKENAADLYLSIHCNGFNGTARGTECWIDRKYMQAAREMSPGGSHSLGGPGIPSSGLRNMNVDADAAFAKGIVDATLKAFRDFDESAKLRSAKYTRSRHGESYSPPKGVKMTGLGTLRDAKLGTENNGCRAALLELEFIDHPRVDQLLNGARAAEVRSRIAGYIAIALVEAL